MMRFCERVSEMDAILDRWRVASDTRTPAPQVVLIKAERGIGKTRLALEFYRRLQIAAAQGEATRYWPAEVPRRDQGMDVNPDPRQCKFDTPIPFLWWGMRAADPGTENAIAGNAISTYEPYLAPHLVALSVKARFIRGGKAIFDVWREIAGGEIANWTGYDSVLSIGEGLFKTVAILRGTFSRPDPIMTQVAMDKQRTDRVEDLMEELGGIFNPRAMSYARTPGVIFIDDAQFATQDPGLAAFAQQLMRTAVAQSWPVLILFTHWRREFSLDSVAEGTSIARMLQQALPQPDDKSPPGRTYLDATNFLEIDLQPLADLSDALRDALPGLTPAQAQALLAHAGGNPRHLEQIIAFLLENEDFFEDFDTARPLTDEGLADALSETHDLFKVVLRRLRGAPQEVQEAICIASLQGVRFVSGVVEDIMAAHLDKTPGAALATAANPYSMVRPEAASQIAEFSERLFYLVAERRRRSLKGLADTEALQTALKVSLTARMHDTSFHDSADPQTLALTYGLVSRVFSDSDAERQMKLMALIRLALLEWERGAHRAAARAAHAVAATLRDSDLTHDDRVLGGLFLIGELLAQDGAPGEARRLLRSARRLSKTQFEVKGTFFALKTVCFTLKALVEAELALGAWQDAQATAAEVVALARDGEARFADFADTHILIAALGTLAIVLQSGGDIAGARSALVEAADLARTRLVLSGTLEDRQLVGNFWTRLSFVEELLGDYDASAKAQAQAHEILDALVARDRSAAHLGLLSVSHKRLAVIASWRKDHELAAREARNSVRLARESLDHSEDPKVRSGMVQALLMLGITETQAGQPAAATAAHREAREIAEGLHRQLGTPDSLGDIAATSWSIGTAEYQRGDYASAVTWFEQAVLHFRHLQDWLDTPDTLAKLANALSFLANARHNLQDSKAAIAHFDEAHSLFRQALKRSDTHVIWSQAARSLIMAGNMARDLGGHDVAVDMYSAAKEILRQMTETPGNDRLEAVLATTQAKLDAALAEVAHQQTPPPD
jgi:tetratricopeptide (TPR) repeat protein